MNKIPIRSSGSMMNRRLLSPAVASTFLITLITTGVFAQSENTEGGRSIVVLDASGSMWDDVDGVVKIDAAKSVVTDLLSKVDPKIELGLIAYGHRRKGDCGDIEVLVPSAANNREAIAKATNSLIPKGKTPLSDAVRMAADSLKFEERKCSVILVSDGIENCGGDPAGLGKELAEKGIDFTCHVVAFDIADATDDLKALCESTGGLYLEADDAGSLATALEAAVMAVVLEKTVIDILAVGPGGKPLQGVKISCYSGRESEEPFFQQQGGTFQVEVEAGNYFVTAEYEGAYLEQSIEIKEGKKTPCRFQFGEPTPPTASEDFETSDNGWIVVGDAQGPSELPTRKLEGGNPGAFMEATDDAAGGIWYWQAPESFLRQTLAIIKQNPDAALKYDQTQSNIARPFEAGDIVISDGVETISLFLGNPPGTDWTSYVVPLLGSDGWRPQEEGQEKMVFAEERVDRATVERILGNLKQLWIRGEFKTGPDFGGIDNIRVE